MNFTIESKRVVAKGRSLDTPRKKPVWYKRLWHYIRFDMFWWEIKYTKTCGDVVVSHVEHRKSFYKLDAHMEFVRSLRDAPSGKLRRIWTIDIVSMKRIRYRDVPWTLEIATDIESMFGLDAEQELVNIIKNTLGESFNDALDEEISESLKTLADYEASK